MRQKKLASAIKTLIGAEIVLSATLIHTAYAQTAPAAAAPLAASGASSASVTTLKKFEVTGSLLKSADKVGFNQVQVVTAKDIQSSGATTVTSFLRDVAANSASSFAENTTQSTAPGGAGMALRGLSEKYTLVLVDGRRVAPYGRAVNYTDTFFDINTIPLNMVERIEIVKTGAVSQYGSDAIAGVINIITKKNFQGVQLDGSYGGSGGATDGGNGTTSLGITAGFGDLNADRFNVTAGLSVYDSNGLTAADRDASKNEDYRGLPGGYLQQSPSYWALPGGNYAPIGSPCPNGGSLVPAAAIGRAGSGNVCVNNNASAYSIQPATDRLSGKIHATFKIDDTTEAYADLWESYNTTRLNAGYPSIGPSPLNSFNPGTGITPIPMVVPASNPYNPYGVNMPLAYSFMNQPQQIKTTSNFFSASTGIKGTLNSGFAGFWDWAASVGHSQSTVNVDQNNLNLAALRRILGGGYNFANPSATPNGLDGLIQTESNQAISKLDVVDITASNSSLFTLPAGDVGLGFGAQFQHQSETMTTFPGLLNGTTGPAAGLQRVNGERNVAAAYYQIDVPIIKNLTFSQSGRYDHYSDFGGAFSPRFALRYQPISSFTTYASYNRGFRAPTLIENSQSSYLGGQPGVVDPYNVLTPNVPATVRFLSLGNPNLQPERTKNYNVGFQLSPNSTTDFGFDWYRIDISNVIGSANAQNIVNANDPSLVHRNADSSISYIDNSMQNLGSESTSGLEATFRKSLPTHVGNFTLSGDWTYILNFKLNGTDGSTQLAGNNNGQLTPFGASMPRWKGQTSLAWNYRKFTTTLTWLYTGPYAITTDGNQPNGVASYSQFNLFATYTGIKHWTLYAGINNLMDKAPPYDSTWPNGGYGVPYDSSQYSDLGRFAQVGATYRF